MQNYDKIEVLNKYTIILKIVSRVSEAGARLLQLYSSRTQGLALGCITFTFNYRLYWDLTLELGLG